MKPSRDRLCRFVWPAESARFFSNIDITSSGCWRWTGSFYRNGYGRFKGGGETLAHRWIYSKMIGKLYPWNSWSIDHLCRNRWCVNPLHLEYVRHAENIRRGLTGMYNSMKTHCKYGHLFNDTNTWVSKNGGRQCKKCNNRRSAEAHRKNKKR